MNLTLLTRMMRLYACVSLWRGLRFDAQKEQTTAIPAIIDKNLGAAKTYQEHESMRNKRKLRRCLKSTITAL
jgi:hypothetical protein